jgi:hypothetical protein
MPRQQHILLVSKHRYKESEIFDRNGGTLVARIEDNGRPFDPTRVPSPALASSLEEAKAPSLRRPKPPIAPGTALDPCSCRLATATDHGGGMGHRWSEKLPLRLPDGEINRPISELAALQRGGHSLDKPFLIRRRKWLRRAHDGV